MLPRVPLGPHSPSPRLSLQRRLAALQRAHFRAGGRLSLLAVGGAGLHFGDRTPRRVMTLTGASWESFHPNDSLWRQVPKTRSPTNSLP